MTSVNQTPESQSKNTQESGEFLYGAFPQDFVFGCATSSYQVEGAWNIDGKGENIWDRFSHSDSSNIVDKSNGDFAMDSYHKYKDDIKLLKDMGVKENSHPQGFSISWARILPLGTTEKINQAGIDYYKNLIKGLLDEGIEPMCTLFHWDLPQNLEDLGGFLNEEIIRIFGDYARICFQNFGQHVKYWVTINEPFIYSTKGYEIGLFAPGIKEPKTGPYKSVHTLIKAHALAYNIYNQEFRAKQKGKVGIAVDTSYYGPADPNSTEDVQAAERAFLFRLGWITHPIYKGSYPPVMKELIDKKSKEEGLEKSRLPTFDEDWAKRIKGSVDFLGVNYYTAELVRPKSADSPPTIDGWNSDQDTERFRDPQWKECGAIWQRDVPWGLRRTLKWLSSQYGNPLIMITENGCSDTTKTLEDDGRVEYFKGHINEVMKAINIDKCNVTAYLAWCLLDVFEWHDGYTVGFGVHHVQRDDPQFPRTPKKSAQFLKQIFANNGFPK